jgi:hypothetical protein
VIEFVTGVLSFAFCAFKSGNLDKHDLKHFCLHDVADSVEISRSVRFSIHLRRIAGFTESPLKRDDKFLAFAQDAPRALRPPQIGVCKS